MHYKPLPTNYRVCSRCIYDERVAAIRFDDQGVCNYCHQVDSLVDEFGTGVEKGRRKLESTFEEIRRNGHGKPYDCVIGVSGGTDSSYMIHLAYEHGLRPLAVHYDNTWNSAIATQNIFRVLDRHKTDLATWVINNKEADDIFRSFFFAGVPEFDAATDLALAETLYRACNRHSIKYILDGHSFTTEGITPLGSNYFDGKYISSIHRMYGGMDMETYPLMTFSRFIWWSSNARIKRVRPFWYLSYSKEGARELLEREYGWEYYGGHHLENRITSFAHSVYLPQKFGVDFRNNTLAALARNGKLSREEAWARYVAPPHVEDDIVSYFKKRLDLTDRQYEEVMAAPPRNWRAFPTYKRRFERLRPLFYMLAKAELVPMSFYLKYCFPAPEQKPAA
jgi:N-acetyl sugar amidotransferase